MSTKAALELVVVGAHLRGGLLNHQLVDLGAKYVKTCKTAPVYKMFSLGPRPALIRHQPNSCEGCGAMEVEVWEVPIDRVGEFLRDGVKAPLALGDVLLDDGTHKKGFVGESYGVAGAQDITATGGWRAHIKQKLTEGES